MVCPSIDPPSPDSLSRLLDRMRRSFLMRLPWLTGLVLQGAREMLEERPPRLLAVEVNSDALDAFDCEPADVLAPLAQASYRLYRVDEDEDSLFRERADRIARVAEHHYREINVVARLRGESRP